MQPEEYQRAGQGLPSFSALGGQGQAGGVAGLPIRETVAPPQGELTRIYEQLGKFQSRICDCRDRLINLNERIGVSHLPTSGNEKQHQQPPQSEGMLPAIDSFLQLMDDGLTALEYQIERTKQL